MRFTQLFGNTIKDSKEFASKNASLLQKAGFIDQVMAGVYNFLPLGKRVLDKIENIIKEEMNKISSEIFMTTLGPKEIWQKTGRLETVDVLMKTAPANELAKQKNDTEYVVNPTHEDMVTALAQKFNLSYKDFPFAVYQIQTKFRNEPRAKSGLLRCREFRMKDLYSFHTSEEDFQKFYDESKKVYMNIFYRLGLGDDTLISLASGGDFTDNFSHEFQTKCEAGEDLIFHSEKKHITYNREIAPSQAKAFDNSDEEVKTMEEVKGEGIIGVEALSKFLNIPVEKTTKTILFENENSEVIAAAVRGDYDVNELKLKKILQCQQLTLARPEVVKEVTGADIGYAGILNLPDSVKVILDDSMKGRVNFECGANKTDYHSINVNFGRDLDEPEKFYDIKIAKEGDIYPETGEKYEVFKAAEVGNIFPLYAKFTEALNYTYTDQDGSQKPILMGSYGIGSSRVMGVIVEKFNDDRGIIWPESVAPYDVHLITLNTKFDQRAEDLIKQIEEQGKSVLWDDREAVQAGAKFADADLIGIPVRLVISDKTGEQIEFKKRAESESKLIDEAELLNLLA